MATSTTLRQMPRQSPPFIVSSVSAMVSSTVGLFGLLLASMGIHGTVGSFVGVSILFLAIALVAAFAPARRAATIDPGVALRYE